MTDNMQHPAVAIIGAGPAGLMAAEVLAQGGVPVTVLDRMPSPARKLLLAGCGGLNLTHATPLPGFLDAYGAARGRIAPAIEAFPPDALAAWANGLGQETFIGTSGRIFPRALKASPLVRAWLGRLGSLGVTLRPRQRWQGWDADGALVFEAPGGPVRLWPAATVLAMGGASWPRLGSDGAWAGLLPGVVPWRPANCGFRIAWSAPFLARHEGAPLKRIAMRFGGTTIRGEAIVTAAGIEGGAVYARPRCATRSPRRARRRCGSTCVPTWTPRRSPPGSTGRAARCRCRTTCAAPGCRRLPSAWCRKRCMPARPAPCRTW
jgi:uncharacterized flavoprotein (TIGR03862 family)